jgi:hypothetical protein
MRRLRHLGALIVELVLYSCVNRSMWPLLVILALIGIAAIAAVGQTVAPALYTLF